MPVPCLWERPFFISMPRSWFRAVLNKRRAIAKSNPSDINSCGYPSEKVNQMWSPWEPKVFPMISLVMPLPFFWPQSWTQRVETLLRRSRNFVKNVTSFGHAFCIKNSLLQMHLTFKELNAPIFSSTKSHNYTLSQGSDRTKRTGTIWDAGRCRVWKSYFGCICYFWLFWDFRLRCVYQSPII